MPRFDGTGPCGNGPTGRGVGPCGGGIGYGRGRGFGGRRGFGGGGGGRGYLARYQPTKGDLENEATALKEELKAVEEEISEMKKNKD